ncbi:MAG TPA: hypothetical protein VFE05_08070 [Longimicrobiaceae bacterium]|nr:hypothetical protein [Longimicrobiaceae bacterium]
MIFPLIPLLFEWLFTGNVALTSVTLVAGNYALAVAFATKQPFIWMLGSFLGVVFAGVFGFCTGAAAHPYLDHVGFIAASGSIIAVFVLHTGERYVRHVVKKEAFPEFMNRGG